MSFLTSFFVTLHDWSGLGLQPQDLAMASSSSVQDEAAARGTPPKQQYTSLSSLMRSSPGREGRNDANSRPGRYGATDGALNDRSRSREGRSGEETSTVKDKKKGKLSMWKMMALTVSMGGSQVS